MGLVPHFTKDLKAAGKPINARAEAAGSSGMFRGALAERRCIVPADAFYEWCAMPDGKQPYAIARKDGAPLAFRLASALLLGVAQRVDFMPLAQRSGIRFLYDPDAVLRLGDCVANDFEALSPEP